MTDQSTRYTLNQPQCHTFLMGILSVNNCGVFQRYNGNDLKFNLREPTRIDFRCNRYITSFCGDRGNLMYIEPFLFHTVVPNMPDSFLI